MATLRELPPWACDLIGFNRAEGGRPTSPAALIPWT